MRATFTFRAIQLACSTYVAGFPCPVPHCGRGFCAGCGAALGNLLNRINWLGN